ncbi:MAG: clostripain-related cysteine peptidase [Defluviitaleaceae bacterium]|nr:clostripain-related cysteine peptidase [Defluviitaleaceae bacterium]
MRIAKKVLAAFIILMALFSLSILYADGNIKPYTIMVYMNGSDLESEHGMGTDDIIEMLESGLCSSAANLILFTGGTLRWLNNVVPPVDCVIWEIADGWMYELENLGKQNMGDWRTLADFIVFSMQNYPAERYGLIMWDHGGGSIAGFGHDEIFDDDNLSLLDMARAFGFAGLMDTPLEFLGFDSCLMATVEMAVTAAPFAKYLIASEDLEPAEGWDYTFLRHLNGGDLDGHDIGVIIVDYFMDYFDDEVFAEETLHLSVVDLDKVDKVMLELGSLMEVCRGYLDANQVPTFRALAGRRGVTKTFGIGSPRDNESDMVDIADMLTHLADIFPYETAAVYTALDEAVLYSRDNADVTLGGLSVFYIYGGKDLADISLSTYSDLEMDYDYTKYLKEFAELLLTVGKDERPNRSVLRGKINGHTVRLYEVGRTAGTVRYAIPARKDGEDCDVYVAFSENYPYGKILGVKYEYGFILQKGYGEIDIGDMLSFYYESGNGTWLCGEEFVVNEPLELYLLPWDE